MKAYPRRTLFTLPALLAVSASPLLAGPGHDHGPGHPHAQTTKSVATPAPAGTTTREPQSRMTPAEALERLRAGNDRFASGRMVKRDLHAQAAATAGSQSPFASVVSCLDSRTPSEIILDQGIGDVFNAAVAGERSSKHEALVERSAMEIVLHAMMTLREKSPLLRERTDSGQAGLAGGLYDLGTGRIEWLDGDARAATRD